MRKIVCAIFSILVMNGEIFPQIIKTFSAEFIREYKGINEKEVIKGKLYFQADSKKLFILVTYPLKQWMVLSGNEIFIFYPNTLQAFRIKMQIPSFMPFFETFISVMKEDYGLAKTGYKFSHYEKKENTLTSYWKPPKNLSKVLGEYRLEYKDNRLISAELKDPKGKILSKIEYSNHFLYGGTYFPLQVLNISEKGGQVIYEKVIYKNPSFNSPLPPEVVDFKIPEGTKVKEVQW